MSTFSHLGHSFESVLGQSTPDPETARKLRRQKVPFLHTNDMKQWIRVDNTWRIARNGTDLLYLKLATSESELLEYIDSISYDPKIM